MRFLHRYAIEIGLPVPVLKKMMTAGDIAQAMAYERVEPFGRYRLDYWFKYVLLVLCSKDRSRTARKLSFSDFDPPWEREIKKGPETLSDQVRKVFGVSKRG